MVSWRRFHSIPRVSPFLWTLLRRVGSTSKCFLGALIARFRDIRADADLSLLSAARLPSLRKARSFAPPPRSGFAFSRSGHDGSLPPHDACILSYLSDKTHMQQGWSTIVTCPQKPTLVTVGFVATNSGEPSLAELLRTPYGRSSETDPKRKSGYRAAVP